LWFRRESSKIRQSDAREKEEGHTIELDRKCGGSYWWGQKRTETIIDPTLCKA